MQCLICNAVDIAKNEPSKFHAVTTKGNVEASSPESTKQSEKIQKRFKKFVENGNLAGIKKLIYSGFYINQILTDLPPLSLAFNCSQFNIADFLINCKADVFQLDSNGKHFPIFYAIKNKCPIVAIQHLFALGFPKNNVVEYICHGSSLHLAIYANYKSAVKYLIKKSVNIESKDINGLTPLHVAVQHNHPKIIKLLIQSGATIDAECQNKFTPLMHAIHDNNLDLVNLMLNLGCDINHEPKESEYCFQKPLNYAAGLGLIEILEILVNHGNNVNSTTQSGDSALHSVAFSDKMFNLVDKTHVQRVIQTLLDLGADIETTNNVSYNPLHVAIIMKNRTVIEALIRFGSKMTSSTLKGDQPLHLASIVGDAKAVKLFLENGADPCFTNANNLSPYDEALMQSDPDTVKMFWRYGYPYDMSKIMTKEESEICEVKINEDILMHVEQQKKFLDGIESGNVDSVNEALKNGAEPRGCRVKMRHPLHFTVSRGLEKIVNILLEWGVCVGGIDENGETPLHLAAKIGHLKICQILLSHGACYNYRSMECSRTPVQLAKRHGHAEVQQLLSTIHRVFVDIRNKNSTKLREMLHEQNENGESIFPALLNCIDRKGLTIMATAIEKGDTDIANCIMHFRLNNFN